MKELIMNAPPDCIRTHSGIYINVFEPTMEMISIEDIAHALSHQCRFSGHLSNFYSVAQHSLHVSDLVSEENKFSALMHDASEAYILDIPTPIKPKLNNYKNIEDNLMRLIARKYSFEYPLNKEVKDADAAMLFKEWDCLMIGESDELAPLTPNLAKKYFLEAFYRFHDKTVLANV